MTSIFRPPPAGARSIDGLVSESATLAAINDLDDDAALDWVLAQGQAEWPELDIYAVSKGWLVDYVDGACCVFAMGFRGRFGDRHLTWTD